MKKKFKLITLISLALLAVAACAPEATPWIPTATPEAQDHEEELVADQDDDEHDAEHEAADEHEEELGEPDVEYTLITGGDTGLLIYIGQGGDIDGVQNPTLTADPGDVVQITLINADNIQHDLIIDEFSVHSEHLEDLGAQTTLKFKVEEEGEYEYYCSVPGHRQAGMVGTLLVGEPPSQAATAPSIVRDPAEVPAPSGDREPTTVQVDLTAQEVVGHLPTARHIPISHSMARFPDQ